MVYVFSTPWYEVINQRYVISPSRKFIK